MAVIKSEFDVLPEAINFLCSANSDRVNFGKLELSQEAATNLATLINGGKTLTVIIKEKVEE